MYSNTAIPNEVILTRIHIVRGQKIILDSDLADLYQVETKNLKRQVKRNPDRFPEDFMFELTHEEVLHLRCQIGTSRLEWGGSRYRPMAFTERGIAMLSSVLGSPGAIQVNIQIIRIFTGMHELMATHREMLAKIEEIEGRLNDHDEKIQAIFDCIKELLREAITDRPPIGFRQSGK